MIPFGATWLLVTLKRRGDRAVLEEAFSGAERDRNYHKLERIDEIGFEQRLQHIRRFRMREYPGRRFV